MLEKKDSKIEKWIDDRYDISPLKNLLLHKKVPVHKFSFFYYLGGITLFFIYCAGYYRHFTFNVLQTRRRQRLRKCTLYSYRSKFRMALPERS